MREEGEGGDVAGEGGNGEVGCRGGEGGVRDCEGVRGVGAFIGFLAGGARAGGGGGGGDWGGEGEPAVELVEGGGEGDEGVRISGGDGEVGEEDAGRRSDDEETFAVGGEFELARAFGGEGDVIFVVGVGLVFGGDARDGKGSGEGELVDAKRRLVFRVAKVEELDFAHGRDREDVASAVVQGRERCRGDIFSVAEDDTAEELAPGALVLGHAGLVVLQILDAPDLDFALPEAHEETVFGEGGDDGLLRN